MHGLTAYAGAVLVIGAGLLTIASILRIAGLKLGEFTIPGFFVIMYFVSAYVGCVLLLFGLDDYAVSLGVIDTNLVI